MFVTKSRKAAKSSKWVRLPYALPMQSGGFSDFPGRIPDMRGADCHFHIGTAADRSELDRTALRELTPSLVYGLPLLARC
jgi:hypothetical protein